MPIPLHTPRINNNDDFVRVSHVYVSPGSFMRHGEPLADLETDKATFTVEAERDGYLLRFNGQIGESIAVGSILAWVGDSADETPPEDATAAATPVTAGTDAPPTLKAAILLSQYGLAASNVPSAGPRLTADDVERYVASRRILRPAPAAAPEDKPSEPGRTVELTPTERGMLRTVLWHKSEAVPAYLEISYDPRPWDEFAADFQGRHRLLMSPLLPLFAWRLAQLAAEQPAINATLAGERKHLYDQVNLGFTVQSGANLYVVVARDAGKAGMLDFVQKLGDLQRCAMREALRPENVSGATIGFSSMARWTVTRHVPVLLPYTALMVAHTAPAGGAASLGVTYDHRMLHGADAVRILRALAEPPHK